MRPFQVSTESRALADHYPNSQAAAAVVPRLDPRELASYASLWLSEGIPSAFLRNPMVYEAMRNWLGTSLGISVKSITLIGSARIGYSMAPSSEFGRAFDATSDLDLAVVSEDVFRDLVADFESWAKEYRDGGIKPSGARQLKLWPENLSRVPKNIARGFIDPRKVPAGQRYPAAAKLSNLTWRLFTKLSLTEGAPRVSTASIRVYRDWPAFIQQMSVNLHALRRRLATIPAPPSRSTT